MLLYTLTTLFKKYRRDVNFKNRFLLSTLKNDPLLYVLDDVLSDEDEEKNIQALIPAEEIDENTVNILKKTGLLNLKD